MQPPNPEPRVTGISKSPGISTSSFRVSSSPRFQASASFCRYFTVLFVKISDAFQRRLDRFFSPRISVLQWGIFSGCVVCSTARNRNLQNAKQMKQNFMSIELTERAPRHKAPDPCAADVCQALGPPLCHLNGVLHLRFGEPPTLWTYTSQDGTQNSLLQLLRQG